MQPCLSFSVTSSPSSGSVSLVLWRRQHVCLLSGPETTFFFFNFFIYPGRTFAKSGGLRSHWSAPWCECVYTNSSLNSTGAVSAVKTVVADGILNQWPAGVEPTLFSDLSATSIFAPLRAGLAHQSCGNTGSVSTDILKYQCREHDALLSTNYVVLRVYLWHW